MVVSLSTVGMLFPAVSAAVQYTKAILWIIITISVLPHTKKDLRIMSAFSANLTVLIPLIIPVPTIQTGMAATADVCVISIISSGERF